MALALNADHFRNRSKAELSAPQGDVTFGANSGH
jgi:hypothetical protein